MTNEITKERDTALPIWADPAKNEVVRPRTKCWGCGKLGCVDKHWGNWCFACNVARMTRLTKSFDQISAVLSTSEDQS